MAFVMASCNPTPLAPANQGARIVRLAFTTERGPWQLSINGEAPRKVSAAIVPALPEQLSLKHPDIVLVQVISDSQIPAPTLYRLATNCSLKQVAVYYLVQSQGSIFKIPVYHWQAPFDNPRDFDQARFYKEGQLFGSGMEGFKKMREEIEKKPAPFLFILGSKYNWDSGLGPFEVPYSSEDVSFRHSLDSHRIQQILPNEMP